MINTPGNADPMFWIYGHHKLRTGTVILPCMRRGLCQISQCPSPDKDRGLDWNVRASEDLSMADYTNSLDPLTLYRENQGQKISIKCLLSCCHSGSGELYMKQCCGPGVGWASGEETGGNSQQNWVALQLKQTYIFFSPLQNIILIDQLHAIRSDWNTQSKHLDKNNCQQSHFISILEDHV